MRWLDCTGGKKQARAISILDDPDEVFRHDAFFDDTMFRQRGGLYDWTSPLAAASTKPKKNT